MTNSTNMKTSSSSSSLSQGKTFLDVVEMAHTKNAIIKRMDRSDNLNMFIRQKYFWSQLRHTFDTSSNPEALVSSVIAY
eukprot:m.98642 g.98642  ORF g.98642 m.98642 type:complete len:79 (+) comp9018_c0_seq1:150-386(+)